MAGPGLRSVCEALGIPPVLHVGSCVDNSRILVLLAALADYLGVDIDQLPVAGAAPEWYSEKAVAIGAYVVASGVTTVLGVQPPVFGSPHVVDLLANGLDGVVGAKFVVEPDPAKAALFIRRHIEAKRQGLGLPFVRSRRVAIDDGESRPSRSASGVGAVAVCDTCAGTARRPDRSTWRRPIDGVAGRAPHRRAAGLCGIVLVGKGGVGKSTLTRHPGPPAGPARAARGRRRRRRAAESGRHPGDGLERRPPPSSPVAETADYVEEKTGARPGEGERRDARAQPRHHRPDRPAVGGGARRGAPGRHGRRARGRRRVPLPRDGPHLERRRRHAPPRPTTSWSWTRTPASSTSGAPWPGASTRSSWSSSRPSTRSRWAWSPPALAHELGIGTVHLVGQPHEIRRGPATRARLRRSARGSALRLGHRRALRRDGARVRALDRPAAGGLGAGRRRRRAVRDGAWPRPTAFRSVRCS